MANIATIIGIPFLGAAVFISVVWMWTKVPVITRRGKTEEDR